MRPELLLNSNFNKRRVDRLQQMLMELTVGNFNFRVAPSGCDDPLEALGALANMMAEELEASFLPKEYKDRYITHDPMSQTAIILDEKLCIQRLHPGITTVLSIKVYAMQGKPLAIFLDKDSQNTWIKVAQTLEQNPATDTTATLSFITGKGLLLPVHCKISSLLGHSEKGKTLLMTFQSKKDDTPDPENGKRISLGHTDARSIRLVQRYILGHIEAPPQSLKTLAHRFGINESKLKQGFKQLYGCTVFEFYRKARLERGKLLIESTELPLKNIAEMVGFKSLPHFSQTFRKFYGYSPSMLKKRSKRSR